MCENEPKSSDLRKDAKQAADYLQKAIEWYERQSDANRIDAMILRKFRNFAAKKAEASVKQTKLTDYFEQK